MIFKVLVLISEVMHSVRHLLSILGLIGVFIWGYAVAHSEVATECKKLNSFYVGDNVYDCKVRDNKESSND